MVCVAHGNNDQYKGVSKEMKTNASESEQCLSEPGSFFLPLQWNHVKQHEKERKTKPWPKVSYDFSLQFNQPKNVRRLKPQTNRSVVKYATDCPSDRSTKKRTSAVQCRLKPHTTGSLIYDLARQQSELKLPFKFVALAVCVKREVLVMVLHICYLFIYLFMCYLFT